MKPANLLAILLTALLTTFSCKESITEPEPPAGRRDYVWKVDTLNYPYATLLRLWGDSPSNLWATSPGDHNLSITHFNGQSWSSYGVTGMNTPYSIWGFSNDNVFIATAGGGVWKFNGSNWIKFTSITKDGRSDMVFNNIWGESANNFYVFGGYPDSIIGAYNMSVIAHYNNKWEVLNTDSIFGLVAQLYKNANDGKVYLQVIKIGGVIHPDSTIIYEYSQEKFKKLSVVYGGGENRQISV